MMTPAMHACLTALIRQPLVRKGNSYQPARWRHWRRGFGLQTVKALVKRGLAREIGDRVVALCAANDN
jgi:hypothetical protein